ncbi:MAG TPA: ribonuclease P protein component [Anaerolineae bacterium]|nr:ribonuclease P protein component [Anaerolineae bacterium]HOQ99154.1 ribonuclease P protein component [Anaerolineae bacterium]HPL28699.1 ribonuclease P protein component [Anaerolineae bacterium]
MERRCRLTRDADFDRVRKQGRSWAQSLFVFSAGRNDLACTRFGFIVSRRIGNAVVRNRVKRQLREAVRRHLGEFPTGWDVVLIARAPIVTAGFADIENALAQALRRTRSWFATSEAAARTD